MKHEEFAIDPEWEGERLDKLLAAVYPDNSRSFFQKLIREEQVLVNGNPQKSGYFLRGDDLVEVTIPDTVAPAAEPENIPLDILYEDEDVLIVNKPKGMVVHPSVGHFSGTLVNAVLYHCKDSLSGMNGELRPGIVHRIDMDTSGSLIVCKNDMSHAKIAEQLKAHTAKRIYEGIVCGSPQNDEGTIDAPIGRNTTDRKKMAVHVKNGRPAVTHYKVLERFGSYTYMQFRLETGRTHQIRVHMASIGHPMLGDAVYSSGKSPFRDLQGQTLHAKTIGFLHPRSGEYLEFSAPLPQYFENLLTILKSRQ